MSLDRPVEPIASWHKMVKSCDPSVLEDLLSDDCVFYSPVVHAPQSGKAISKLYLSAAVKVFSEYDFSYIKEIIADKTAALEFVVEMDGILVNGVDIISWNDFGKITEFKVFVRPLKGINLLHQKMAEMLQK